VSIIVATGIATGCVYALVGVGFSLIYRTTGIVNFAQGVFVALGGMSAFWLLSVVKLPYPVALLGSLAITVAAGLLLWVLVVLPIWRRRSDQISVMMASLVVAGLITILLQKWLGTQPRTLPEWLPGVRIELPGGSITGQYALMIVATLALVAGVGAFLKWSTLGRAMRACAASRETSALLGISPERIGALSMAATAGLGGLGGPVHVERCHDVRHLWICRGRAWRLRHAAWAAGGRYDRRHPPGAGRSLHVSRIRDGDGFRAVASAADCASAWAARRRMGGPLAVT
jgi:branched-subunit amino acid ABC-type transport system permease component